MAVLMTGIGREVIAQQDADLYAGIVGSGTIVLPTGSKMAASIVGKDIVRISDGVAMKEGRVIYIEASTYDDFEIPEAREVGVFDYTYIGYRIYTASDGTEKIEKAVSKSKTSTAGLRAGSQSMYIWLYGVTHSFMGVEGVEKLYDEHLDIKGLGKYYSVVKSEKVQLEAGIDKKYGYSSVTLPEGSYMIFAQALFSSVANATGTIEISLAFEDASNNICRTRVAHNTANDQVIQCSAPVTLERERAVELNLSSTTKRAAGGGWIKAIRIS